MNTFVSESKLNEFNVFLLCEFKFVARLWHLLALVNLGHFDTIEVVCHTYALYKAVSHKDLYLVEVNIGSLHEEQ